jgi:GT2 family glycosyltransferase
MPMSGAGGSQKDVGRLVSVCVPTHNRSHLLGDVLESIANQEIGSGIELEVVVVDDGSTDDTESVVAALAERWPIIRYVRTPGLGAGAARNTAAQLASGEWLAFFDDDQLASRAWISELLRVALTEDAHCVGGPVLLRLPDGSTFRPTRTVRWLLGENPLMTQPASGIRSLDPRLRLDIPGGGNSLVRRDMYEDLGGFDADRTYGEDFDFFTRAWQQGFRVCSSPEAIAYHLIPAERLEPEYLYDLADKAGRTQARFDHEYASRWRLPAIAALRCVQVAVALPRLFVASMARNVDKALGARCSLRIATSYLAASARESLHMQ